MTFLDRYQSEDTWHGRATIMEIYHYAMCHKEKGWNITKTAEYFGVSIGLVSENLRLANYIHTNHDIIKVKTRQDALNKIK